MFNTDQLRTTLKDETESIRNGLVGLTNALDAADVQKWNSTGAYGRVISDDGGDVDLVKRFNHHLDREKNTADLKAYALRAVLHSSIVISAVFDSATTIVLRADPVRSEGGTARAWSAKLSERQIGEFSAAKAAPLVTRAELASAVAAKQKQDKDGTVRSPTLEGKSAFSNAELDAGLARAHALLAELQAARAPSKADPDGSAALAVQAVFAQVQAVQRAPTAAKARRAAASAGRMAARAATLAPERKGTLDELVRIANASALNTTNIESTRPVRR